MRKNLFLEDKSKSNLLLIYMSEPFYYLLWQLNLQLNVSFVQSKIHSTIFENFFKATMTLENISFFIFENRQKDSYICKVSNRPDFIFLATGDGIDFKEIQRIIASIDKVKLTVEKDLFEVVNSDIAIELESIIYKNGI